MLRIEDVPHMIKDNNLAKNQETHLGTIKQLRLQVLEWWANDRHRSGLAIIVTTWTVVEIKSSTTKINIESTSGGEIKVAHHGKVETGHTWMT